MIRNRILLKTFAVFFLVEMFSNAVAPAVSWALTAGPTAPEYTSFEPVDTSNMVNLATGDLAYNIPLLEVPGPSGGYPLSLSYHAGIMPEEEASWVGLGFTLNPGAISRTINGYADDQLGSTRTRTDVNTGGERNSFYAGVGLPYASAGLSVSHDSNLGTGIGTNISVGPNFKAGPVNVNASISASQDGYGNDGFGGDIGLSVGKAEGLNVTVGLSTNFKSVSFNSGVGVGSSSILGAKMESNGVVSSVSVAGASQSNNRAGKWSTNSFGMTVPIPIGESGLFLNLGYNYLRYYSYESSDVKVIGTLHAGESASKNHDSWAFDSYALVNTDVTETSFKASEPEKSAGGSFPAYDSYQVNAQGLNGSMHPYILTNGTLFRQNVKTSDNSAYNIEYKSASPNFYSSSNFRFENEFSNTRAFSDGQMTIIPSQYNGSKYVSSRNTIEKMPPVEGYNSGSDHLAGSRHIEWFTNEQIQNGAAKAVGFVNHELYSNRVLSKYEADISQQVGGFMITNETGVTYHYSIPVYVYNEFFKSFLKGKENDIYQSNLNKEPYAYTWLLTAVTGPDYYDKNDNGIADMDDWGYWVRYDYGMWANNYSWRNPAIGAHADINPDLEYYSSGQKELYYLNAIVTKTHTALFEKEIRADSKGVVVKSPLPIGALDKNFDAQTFGINHMVYGIMTGGDPATGVPVKYLSFSTSTLRLKCIYLIDNEKLAEISSTNDLLNKSSEYNHELVFRNSDNISPTIRVHYGENILDKSDLDEIFGSNSTTTFREAIKEKSLRVISFNHNYSLQDGTGNAGVPNSFDDAGDIYTTNPDQNIINNKFGKLTLTELVFQGKGGVTGLIPSMKFEYGKNPVYKENAYDIWGMYKSDYVPMETDNISRFVTRSSSENVDAWSLSKVITSLGSTININYESDDYLKPELYNANLLNVKDVIPETDGVLKISFYNNVDLRNYLAVDQKLSLVGLTDYVYQNLDPNGVFNCNDDDQLIEVFFTGAVYLPKAYNNLIITSINGDFIEVRSDELFNDMTTYGQYKIGDFMPYPGGDNDCRQGSYSHVQFNVKLLDINFQGGNLCFTSENSQPGGGLRVSEISISKLLSIESTKFTYRNGVTSFEPFGLDVGILVDPTTSFKLWKKEAARRKKGEDAFYQELQRDFSKLLTISRELPPPGVMYQSVEVNEYIQQDGEAQMKLPGKKVFEFQTFDQRMIERISVKMSNIQPVKCYDEGHNEVPCTGPLNGPPRAICYDADNNPTPCETPSDSYRYTPLTINDFTSWLGALKSISVYGENEQLLTKTENIFLHDLNDIDKFKTDLRDRFDSQGKISQSFTEYRVIRNDNGTYRDVPVFSMKNEYPSVQIGQKVTNYKTGIISNTTNLAFDLYTGAPIKVLTTDGYGNSFISESKLAYNIPEYSGMTTTQLTNKVNGMGLKVHNVKNRNMLTQQVANYTYKVDPSDYSIKTGLLSASAQTWNNISSTLDEAGNYVSNPIQYNIWRPDATYSWKGDDKTLNIDGLYPISSFSEYNFASGFINVSQWQKNGSITMYDVNSHALEASDLNGDFGAARMTKDQTRVIATIVNSKYNDFSYTGVEDWNSVTDADNENLNNQFKLGADAVVVTDKAHTGIKSVKTDFEGVIYENNITPNKNYTFSFWASSPDAVQIKWMVNGQSTNLIPSNIRQAGNWYQYNVSIFPKSTHLKIWCQRKVEGPSGDVYFDDIRISPTASTMTSYVYNQWGELSHILDNNNMFTEYRYDVMGRLTETYRETFNNNLGVAGKTKLSTVEYNYGLNHPYIISLNATTTGGPGQLLPAGVTQAAQGDNITFSIVETCSNPKFNGLYVDAQQIDLHATSPIILADGTQLIVADKVFTLKNIQSAHTISANFYKAGVAGTVECVGYQNADGTVCYDGSYRYAYYDACGNAGGWTHVSEYSKLPANLRQLAGNCCSTTSQSSGVTKTSNSSTSCTCISTYQQ